MVNLERNSGDIFWELQRPLSRTLSAITHPHVTVWDAASIRAHPARKQGETVAGGSDPVTNTHIKHISREGYQEFLAVNCIKTLGKIFDGAMQMPTTYREL